MAHKTTETDVNSVERQRQALILRKGGHDYTTIANKLGYSDKSGAWRACMKALRQIPANEAKELRTLESERLDELWKVYFVKALKGDQGSAHLCLKIIEARARLLGLNLEPELGDDRVKTIIREIPSGFISGPSSNGKTPIEAGNEH